MGYHSGKLGTSTVGGTELPTINWGVKHDAELQRFRNSKTGSVDANEATFNNFEVTIVYDYDFANPPMGTPKLYAGQTITNTSLYMNGTGDTTNAYGFPKLTVTSSPVTVDINGKIGSQITAVPNGGPVTLPGGATIS